jgi:hypothetical protein
MDATADAIFLMDRASMLFADINDTACRMFGYAVVKKEFDRLLPDKSALT